MQPPIPTPEAGKPKGEVLEQLTTFMYLNLAVFFENYIASTSQEVRRTIKECIDKYFSKKYNDRDSNSYMEHFDSISGLWFEVKFSDSSTSSE